MAIAASNIIANQGTAQAYGPAAKAHGKTAGDKPASFDEVMARHDSDVAQRQAHASGKDHAARSTDSQPARSAAKSTVKAASAKAGQAEDSASRKSDDAEPQVSQQAADKAKDEKADDQDKQADAANDNEKSQDAMNGATPVQLPQTVAMQAPAAPAGSTSGAFQDAAATDGRDAAAGNASAAAPAPAPQAGTPQTGDAADAQTAPDAAAAGKAQGESEFQKMLGAAKPGNKEIQAAKSGKETKTADAKAEMPAGGDAAPADAGAKPAAPAVAAPPAGIAVAASAHDGKIFPAPAPAASSPGAPPAPNMNGLAVEIAAKSQSGAKQFDIRLDPPELGRVEVRLSIDASGKAQAHLSADQPQTLDLLQKDAPALTRALREAGLDVSQDGLNFSLRGQQQQAGGDQGGDRNCGTQTSRTAFSAAKSIETVSPASSAISGGLGLLDIKV